MILIVDDCAEARGALGEIVKAQGYIPFCVESGDVAIAFMRAIAVPSLVVVASRVGEEDGLSVIGRIREDGVLAEVPVLVMTVPGDHLRLTEKLVRAAGGQGLVRRGVDRWEDVIRCIRGFAGRPMSEEMSYLAEAA